MAILDSAKVLGVLGYIFSTRFSSVCVLWVADKHYHRAYFSTVFLYLL